MIWRGGFAVFLTAALSLFAFNAPRAQFNGCPAGFCSPPAASGGGGSCNPPLLSCVTVPSGLVGWWPLDNSTTSGTTTNDLSSSGLNGTLVNTPTTGLTGQINQAFGFTASSFQYLNVAGTGTGALDITGPISVTAWVTSANTGLAQEILAKGFDGTNTQYELNIAASTGLVTFRTYNGTVHGVTSVSTATSGSYLFWAGTFDGTTWRIYLNATLDNSSADSQAPVHTAQVFQIGSGAVNGSPSTWMNGTLDDVRVYNRALSGAEITSIYNNGVLGKP